MTVVAASIVRGLRAIPEGELRRDAAKLLTFVAKRQDASLQAGHFNDFALVVQLRSALHRAAIAAERSGDGGLDPLDIGQTVTGLLELDRADYNAARPRSMIAAPNGLCAGWSSTGSCEFCIAVGG